MLDTKERSAALGNIAPSRSVKSSTADYGISTLKNIVRSVEGVGAAAGFLTIAGLLVAADVIRSGLYVEVLHNQVPAFNTNPEHFLISTFGKTFLNDKFAEGVALLVPVSAGSAVYHAGAALYNGAEFGYHGIKEIAQRSRRQRQTSPIR